MTKAKFTESQQWAIRAFRDHLANECAQYDKGPNGEPTGYGAQITKWEVRPDYDGRGNVWISAEIELIGLPVNNCLRAVSHEWYYGNVGKRGAITLSGYPRSYAQFVGGKCRGFNIR